ncbi:MAG: ribosomal protein S18-alanine N-acetyltransferase [Magnetococcales bacterium]|nr:ribosomal protein S18-alanine N-acetyltransferase [Magnetococcales bacterium]
MKKKHLVKVVDLDGKIAQSPWTMPMFLEELELGSFCRVLLDEYGEVIGYCISRLQVDEWHLLTVGINSSHRNMGLGSRLLKDLIRKAALNYDKAVLLEVRSSNAVAINLYKKHGFTVLHIREGYYKTAQAAEDAVVMKRLIKGGDREIIS